MIGYLFYDSLAASVLLFPVGIFLFLRWERACIRKKEQLFEEQFREAMRSLAMAMRVGYSVENAMKETKKDLALLYGEETAIQREFTHMIRQLYLQVPVEQVLSEWAERVHQEDVRNFVNVFSIAKRSGGNVVKIMNDSVSRIREKMEVRAEIETILTARKYEFRVMTVIPFGMIAYMRASFPEFMGILYGNPLGIGVMSVCLSVYAGAYVIGERIVNIEI